MYNSKQEVIEICGKTFIVHEANTVMGAKRDVLLAKHFTLWADTEVDPDNLEENALRYIETFLYPTLISVTTCNEALPTLEEFKSMPDSESKKWRDCAEKLNPSYFDFSSEEKKS